MAVANSSDRRQQARASVGYCRPLQGGSINYRRATLAHICRTVQLSTSPPEMVGRLKFSGLGPVGRRNGYALSFKWGAGFSPLASIRLMLRKLCKPDAASPLWTE